MSLRPSVRICLDLLLILSVIEGWWFAAALLAIAGAWLSPFFFEALLAGAVYDFLFDIGPGTGIMAYSGFTASVLVVLVLAVLKKVVRK